MVAFSHVWFHNSLGFLQLVGVLDAILDGACISDKRNYFITVGLSLYNTHDVVSDALGEGIKWRVLGEVESLFLLIWVIDLDVDETFL